MKGKNETSESEPGRPVPGIEKGSWLLIGGFALLKILLHLPWLQRYGYHHDELYFLDCGRHLAFGYVDHAPFVPWLARLADTLFGQSLFGLRIFSVLAGAAAIFVTGMLTARLGGKKLAITLSCLAMIIAPVYLRTAQMLTIPAFELLYWVVGAYLLMRLVQEEDPKLWLGIGMIVGLGLMTKHSMAFFALGMSVGLAATPLRRHFLSPWPYAGAALAFLLFLPNLLWQTANSWPTLEFLRLLNRGTMSRITLPQFVIGQFLYLNPFTAMIWIAGLFFLFGRAGRPYRILGWIYVAVFVLLVALRSKIYYLAPAYPILFAAGSVALERFAGRRTRIGPLLVSTLAVGGLLMAPLSLPIFSLPATERYITSMTAGAFKNVYELTGDLRGQFGWPERVAAVARVWRSLPQAEQRETIVFADWYGPAGAVNYLGRAESLPIAVSGHMTYYLWGLPDKKISTVLVLDRPQDGYGEFFADVRVGATVELENVNPWERTFTVLVCRKPRMDLHLCWPRLKNYR